MNEKEIEKLKEENEGLKEANTIRTNLVSTSAHQLRTALSAFKWTLKMFLDKDFGDLSYEQEDYVKKLMNSNERMIELVNKLLILSHSEEASTSLNCTKVSIVDLLEELISEFYCEAKKKSVNIVINTPKAKIPDIKCDQDMVRVILENLIENAIKYSNSNTDVSVSIEQKDNNIEISVHDNGIGIEDKDKDKIFHKLFRANNAIMKDSNGSGLGLFTTKDMVERHNGKIWFESNPEDGTAFHVILPVS